MNHVMLLIFISLLLSPSLTVHAQEPDCLKCHRKLVNEKIVHPAVPMGCQSCHTEIDARRVPHKTTGGNSKGLSTEQPELCYGCHDKSIFEKKNIHAAVGMGCTGCHNPHSAKNAKLLSTEPPALCFTCHDQAEFTKKNVHPPVASGMCLSCHSAHSSDEPQLLIKRPKEVCLDCHKDVTTRPHAIAGFSSKGHPLGDKGNDRRDKQILKDPTRPDREFYCGSCHTPHSSDSPRLFRFNARSSMSLCSNCHKM